jgi:hypothetical protein
MAAGETTLLYELLKDSDGVVPIKSLLNFYFERLDEVETSVVGIPGFAQSLAYVRTRLPFE